MPSGLFLFVPARQRTNRRRLGKISTSASSNEGCQTMEPRALHRFALVLLACLVCPVAGNALICPPGEREEAGRCVPASGGAPHFEKRMTPEFKRMTPEF